MKPGDLPEPGAVRELSDPGGRLHFEGRLPGMRGTLSPCFVLVLAAIAQLSLGEVAVMATVVGIVQVLWRFARRPMLAQVLFSPASLTLSAAFAYLLCRVVLEPWLGHSLVGELALATLVLFGSNMVMLATVLALVDGNRFGPFGSAAISGRSPTIWWGRR